MDQKMIKVVHLQIFSEDTGRAALGLHQAFLRNGIGSIMITLKPAINDDGKIKQKGKLSKAISWINKKLEAYINRNNIKEFGLFSWPVFGSDFSQMDEIRNANYIYIHWVLQGFMNLSSFKQLSKLGKPIIFFMHDMWAITGGCHYSFSCEKYKSICYNCQIFPGNKKNDLSSKEFKKKLKLYSNYNRFYFVAPSQWLYNCAKQSGLLKEKPVFYIPNLLEKIYYKPIDKNIAKQILNIEATETVIAFGAVSVDSPYKGWAYLQKALEILKEEENFKKITVLIFGNGYNKEIDDTIPFKTKFLGYLRDEYSTALVYNAADVFIAPSLADNLPTTVLESLNCGTPVVGFNVGGIPDMIKHKENGYLAKYKNAADICEGIKYCIENNIKGYNLPRFDPTHVVNEHLKLFEEIQLKK